MKKVEKDEKSTSLAVLLNDRSEPESTISGSYSCRR